MGAKPPPDSPHHVARRGRERTPKDDGGRAPRPGPPGPRKGLAHLRGRTPDANRTEPRAARQSSGAVVALFPAGGARRSPTSEQLDAVLAAFLMADRMSLRRLRLLGDLPHELVVRCVERLAADGLLAVERRPDGNESRGIASLTDEGRRSLARPGTAG